MNKSDENIEFPGNEIMYCCCPGTLREPFGFRGGGGGECKVKLNLPEFQGSIL